MYEDYVPLIGCLFMSLMATHLVFSIQAWILRTLDKLDKWYNDKVRRNHV